MILNPITAKLTIDQIVALESMMCSLEKYKPKSIEEKVTYSVIIDLSDKINKPYNKIIKSTDLFNANKKVKIQLKFHEAFALVGFVDMHLKTLHKESKPHNDLLQISLFLQEEFAKH